MSGDVATVALHTAIGMRTAAGSADDDGAPVTTPRTPAREAAERELSKREYHTDDPGLLQRLLDWLWEHISSLLDSAAQATPGGWVGLTVVACVLLLLVVALRLRLGRLRPGPTTETGALFDNRPRSAAEHRATADKHAAADRWSEALQERMRAVFRSLEERALLDRRPGRTADEAAFEAGLTLPDHADALKAAVRAFNEVTYAERRADPAAYRTVSDLDSAIQHATPTPRLAGAGDSRDTPAGDEQGRKGATAITLDGGGR